MTASERLTPAEFLSSDGVDDWHVLIGGVIASADFRTGTFDAGVAFVIEIGRLAAAANHHPDVDLRYTGVTIRLTTHDVDGLSDRDVALAREISQAARALGIVPGRYDYEEDPDDDL